MNDMQTAGNKILNKGLSGRFISLTFVVITYCLIMVATLLLVKSKVLEWEAFITIFTPFALTAQGVIQSYFERKDRKVVDNVQNNS